MEPIVLSLVFYLYIIGFCELSKQAVLALTRNYNVRLVMLEILGTIQVQKVSRLLELQNAIVSKSKICGCLFEGGLVAKYYGPLGMTLGIWVFWIFILYFFCSFRALGGYRMPLFHSWIHSFDSCDC